VLLLESNISNAPLVNKLLCGADALNRTQYQVTSVKELGQLQIQFSQTSYDVALCAPSSFQPLHKLAPQLPIIVFTDTDDDSDAAKALQSGAKDHLNLNHIDAFSLTRAIRYAIERQQIETALQSSENRFRALLENSSDGIALVNAEGLIIYNSPAYERILGYEPGGLLGQSALTLLHPDDLAFGLEQLGKLAQSPGIHISASLRQQHKNGTWRWLEGTAISLLHDPHVNAIVTNFRDVTERKLAEEQLRYQAAIAENISEAVITADANSVIKSWNKAAERLHGYSAE
jgi:PAS domain S-box-containing protein